MQRAKLNLFLDRSIRLPLILERLNYSEILHSTKYALSISFFPSLNEKERLQLGLLTARIFGSQTKNVRNKSAFLSPRQYPETLLSHCLTTSPSWLLQVTVTAETIVSKLPELHFEIHDLKIASTLLGLIWSQLTSTKFFVITCGPFLKNKAFFW